MARPSCCPCEETGPREAKRWGALLPHTPHSLLVEGARPEEGEQTPSPPFLLEIGPVQGAGPVSSDIRPSRAVPGEASLAQTCQDGQMSL